MLETKAAETKFKPYVSNDETLPEFTPKAIILGALFGLGITAIARWLGQWAGAAMAFGEIVIVSLVVWVAMKL